VCEPGNTYTSLGVISTSIRTNKSTLDQRLKLLPNNIISIFLSQLSNPIAGVIANLPALWLCDSCCSSIETQSNLLFCPSYSTLMEGKGLSNDDYLIAYIQNVMQIRTKLKLRK
jgi:hypothetical protein